MYSNRPRRASLNNVFAQAVFFSDFPKSFTDIQIFLKISIDFWLALSIIKRICFKQNCLKQIRLILFLKSRERGFEIMSREEIKLRNKIGSPADGDDEFFGREEKLDELIQKIIDGNSLHISAPRRIGKTSLMFRAEKELTNRGHICLKCDLGGLSSPSDWIRKLIKENENLLRKLAKGLMKNIDDILTKYYIQKDLRPLDMSVEMVINDSNWKEAGKNLFKELYHSCPNGEKVVIFIDELAVMIERMQKEQSKELRHKEAHKDVDFFLAWLGSAHREFHEKISFVAASSIGLLPLLGRLNLSAHINYLADFPLEAWDTETAKECILALARGKEIKISDETAKLMTEMTATSGRCSPYYVQVFFSVANDNLFSKERDSYSKDELLEIYRKYLIRGNAIRPTLKHMIERLKKSLSVEEYNFAEKILEKLAKNNGVTAVSEVKNIKGKVDKEYRTYVLDTLEHDGYIEKEGGGYRFRDSPFRDWWSSEYGNGK